MSRSVAIIGALLLALSLWLGWQLRDARRDVQDKDGVITELKDDLSRTTSQLVAVDLMAKANNGFQLAYQQQQDAIAVAVAARAEKFKRLTNENPEVKRWADAPLPADVIRMQKRPAITGAAGYAAYLSENSTLPTSGE
ncbi:Rz-like lysis system protein LysB [Franconibacter helveticus 513]|uniref:Rz-like lysis system protein LysB n=1 Tax=Franconibacter helveticus TaxID=357240 RepID=UPI000410C6AA|nr:Rz-like lysis system protein LysB [Franconibacter helveticus]